MSTSFRTDEETMSRLDEVARAMGRSRSWALNRAVEEFLAYHEWFLSAVDKGVREADEGRFATSQAMEELFAKYGG